MELKDLPQVHAGGHAQRSEDNVYRAAIRHVRHVFLGKDAGNNALVAVATCELVADRYRAQLRYLDMDALDDAGVEVVPRLARKYFDADDAAALAVLHAQRRVLNIASLVAEDGAQEGAPQA